MWKNMLQPYRSQMIIWRMRFASCIPKATNTHSEYVILIAFPLQQWLNESASMLRYTYIACLISLYLCSFSDCPFMLLALCNAVTFTTSINNAYFLFLYELRSTFSGFLNSNTILCIVIL